MGDRFYELGTEGKRDFVKVEINTVDLYIRCDDDNCDTVTSVKVKFADGDDKFNKTYQCACTRECTMSGVYQEPLVFTVFGGFAPDRMSLTDRDVAWTGYAFGVMFPFRTAHGGCWTMDQSVFGKIAPRALLYRERVIEQDQEFEIVSLSDEHDDHIMLKQDHPNLKSNCLKKINKVADCVCYDVAALRPNVRGIYVAVDPVVISSQ